MPKRTLARRLIEATPEERRLLLTRHADKLHRSLAEQIKDEFDRADGGDPTWSIRIAETLKDLAATTNDAAITAFAKWTEGIVTLNVDGQAESGLESLSLAGNLFAESLDERMQASVDISRLQALAVLGRYDEAIACGMRAHEVFLGSQDDVLTGKIEQNLGNVYLRRDRYHEAEMLYHAARRRFIKLGEPKRLAQIDTCLASTLILQYRFREADALYREALALAKSEKMLVWEAVIEGDLGCLALFQCHYGDALTLLESSRRRYESLGMRHESAISELEVADAYLELNLAPEAEAIYSRVIPVFSELGMRAELARAAVNAGRAFVKLERFAAARTVLAQARDLFSSESNDVGVATVALAEAVLNHRLGEHARAGQLAAEAEAVLLRAGAQAPALSARLLRAESAYAMGENRREIEELLETTLAALHQPGLERIKTSFLTLLGLNAQAAGDKTQAEKFFLQAVETIEALRAPLPADEFRTAFLADKLTPYQELARLHLDCPTPKVSAAWEFVERAKSRSLLDMMSGKASSAPPRDDYEASLTARREELRSELNWFYSQMNRVSGEPSYAALEKAARERENAISELQRQLRRRNSSEGDLFSPPTLGAIQTHLGSESVLVEYHTLDDELLAFVITDADIRIFRALGSERETLSDLASLQFQLHSMRHRNERIRRHMPQLLNRIRHYLKTLYDRLLRPLEASFGDRRLVVIPHRALHYVPFHALFDGDSYVVERRETCVAPSAGVLARCLEKSPRPPQKALLFGIGDEFTPHVSQEIAALAKLFPKSKVFLNDQATLSGLRAQAGYGDVLHLACHGNFRRDNPMFSSLRLGDGWMTVQDVFDLELNCGLVTLSACETGVNAVAPGDELIGLARGFLSNGTPSLLVSLWKVDDSATSRLITSFYHELLRGENAGSALRRAQCAIMRDDPHPYFWSPFTLVGRW
jgi:CHAT domain-containing protein